MLRMALALLRDLRSKTAPTSPPLNQSLLGAATALSRATHAQ